MNDVAAIILAAGRSRRMGAFKALLPFGDATVIECCVRNFRLAAIDQIVIVAGHRAEEVRDALADASVTFVTNPNPDSEMGVSIGLGIDAIGTSVRAVLITPVDHPAVPSEIIRTLVDAWRRGAKLIQPEHEGQGGHPVMIDLSYRDELTSLDEDSGLRGFFARHATEVLRLPVKSPFVARDMDTWDDYRRLHQDVFGRKPEGNAEPKP